MIFLTRKQYRQKMQNRPIVPPVMRQVLSSSLRWNQSCQSFLWRISVTSTSYNQCSLLTYNLSCSEVHLRPTPTHVRLRSLGWVYHISKEKRLLKLLPLAVWVFWISFLVNRAKLPFQSSVMSTEVKSGHFLIFLWINISWMLSLKKKKREWWGSFIKQNLLRAQDVKWVNKEILHLF